MLLSHPNDRARLLGSPCAGPRAVRPRKLSRMPERSTFALAFFVVGGLLFLLGCEEEPAPQGPQDGPQVVVRELLSRLRRVHGDPQAGEKVAELLWEPARENLAERAKRASAVSGRELMRGEMLAPSWLSFYLVPERFEWRRQGGWAEVQAIAADGQSSTVRCVLEEGEWKVVLELPPLPPIRQRKVVEGQRD